jgi:hypothetical protein
MISSLFVFVDTVYSVLYSLSYWFPYRPAELGADLRVRRDAVTRSIMERFLIYNPYKGPRAYLFFFPLQEYQKKMKHSDTEHLRGEIDISGSGIGTFFHSVDGFEESSLGAVFLSMMLGAAFSRRATD